MSALDWALPLAMPLALAAVVVAYELSEHARTPRWLRDERRRLAEIRRSTRLHSRHARRMARIRARLERRG